MDCMNSLNQTPLHDYFKRNQKPFVYIHSDDWSLYILSTYALVYRDYCLSVRPVIQVKNLRHLLFELRGNFLQYAFCTPTFIELPFRLHSELLLEASGDAALYCAYTANFTPVITLKRAGIVIRYLIHDDYVIQENTQEVWKICSELEPSE